MYGSEVQTFFGLLDVVLNFKYYTSTLYGKGGGGSDSGSLQSFLIEQMLNLSS